MKPYLMQIDLESKLCLVVGGGPIALHKTRHLVASGARVTLVSSSIHEGFGELRLHTQHLRRFEDADIDGMTLVHAATNDPGVNVHIAKLCADAGIPCCAAHDTTVGSFSVPAVLDSGDLRISVSTNGKSPSYGARLRRNIEEQLSENLDAYLNFLGEAREQSKQQIEDGKLRMRFNAYLASEEGQLWFENTEPDERAAELEGLMCKPESISEIFEPRWS
ncbi:MAG: bifunctional precorrin-2 dehydrogenase/sirohydrochlorin ferrochelatase [Candidatus Hydrogenedentota bacterium]